MIEGGYCKRWKKDALELSVNDCEVNPSSGFFTLDNSLIIAVISSIASITQQCYTQQEIGNYFISYSYSVFSLKIYFNRLIQNVLAPVGIFL
ncbi:unnamed protein product [Nezara viridula]|uniref:Uncharacterized protein n=1 Tax=Nezara viridula TaxID=85310 RepID=A0A9P0MP82_NEZVI|nr:unnamed protein product [Nezara viridula]